MKNLPTKSTLVATSLAAVLILVSPVFAQTASPSPSDTASPSPSASPSPTASPSPSPSPSSSPSPSPTASTSSAVGAASPSPSSSAPNPSVKGQVLGAASSLGATGSEKDLPKWLFVVGSGLLALVLGLRLVRSHDQD